MVGDLVKSFLNEIGFERERERENLLLPSDLFSELGGLLSDSLHSRANGFEALHKPEFRSPTNNQPRSFLGPKHTHTQRERLSNVCLGESVRTFGPSVQTRSKLKKRENFILPNEVVTNLQF